MGHRVPGCQKTDDLAAHCKIWWLDKSREEVVIIWLPLMKFDPEPAGTWGQGCISPSSCLAMTLSIDLLKLIWCENEFRNRGTAAATKSCQSCPTLSDPVDSSPPGSAIPGILQARTLEWVAISFSSGWKWKVKVKSLSLGWVLETPWTAAYQAPLSMGFSRQEYWSGVPSPSP